MRLEKKESFKLLDGDSTIIAAEENPKSPCFFLSVVDIKTFLIEIESEHGKVGDVFSLKNGQGVITTSFGRITSSGHDFGKKCVVFTLYWTE